MKSYEVTNLDLNQLRLAKPLELGNVLTVEPGIYFIPELIDLWRSENKFENFIEYEKVETYKGFSGVRIEDNILVNTDGAYVLGNDSIPKTIEAIENLKKG